VQRGAVAFAVFVVGYRTGWNRNEELETSLDTLHLVENNESNTVYRGRYVDTPGSQADLFVPIKGLRFAGHSPRPYRVAEMGASMVDHLSKPGISDDDPAIISLEPQYTLVSETDWGTEIAQRTAGLEPDAVSSHSTLHATLPEYEDEEMEALAETAREKEQQNALLYDRLSQVLDELENARELSEDPIMERVDDILEKVNMANYYARGNPSSAPGGGSPKAAPGASDFEGTGFSGSHAQNGELEQVEQEVTPDED
jgi:hypothetical protein